MVVQLVMMTTTKISNKFLLFFTLIVGHSRPMDGPSYRLSEYSHSRYSRITMHIYKKYYYIKKVLF